MQLARMEERFGTKGDSRACALNSKFCFVIESTQDVKHPWGYRAQEKLVLTNCLGSGVGNVERGIQLVRILGRR